MTNPEDIKQKTKTPTFKTIDREIRALNAELEQDNTLMAETQSGRLERVLKVYGRIKPLLTAVSMLPLIPSTWRAALVIFNQALEALAGVGGEMSPDFKAGKDL